ncbi:hypothetical protein V6N11_080699 [Hibiscus sabdariffa]|uniref:Uncharacterized protein n=1 Tax=Hibiscus sabdariffa TaxID=183260 RepID=A0ABR2QHN7_9ROSI
MKTERQKKFGPFLDLCVSSLRRGHANLLCIVPILSDVPEGTNSPGCLLTLNYSFSPFLVDVGYLVGSQLNRELACKKENGDAGDRTPCLSHAKRALYHLSYIPCT